MVADVGDPAAVEGAFATVRAGLGGVDGLVHAAAILGPIAPLAQSDPAAWAEVQRVNVVGAYHCLRAVLRTMPAEGGGAGTVLGITSGAARNVVAWHSAYDTSKAAFEQLFLAAQADVADSGVALAVFDPGGVDTDMMAAVRAHDFPAVAAFRRLHQQGALRPPSRVASVIAALLWAPPPLRSPLAVRRTSLQHLRCRAEEKRGHHGCLWREPGPIA